MCVNHNPPTHEADMAKAINTLKSYGITEIRGYKWVNANTLQGTTLGCGPKHKVGLVRDKNPASIKNYPATNHGLHFFIGEREPKDRRLSGITHFVEVVANVDDLVAINGGPKPQAACTQYRVVKIFKLTAAAYIKREISYIKSGQPCRPAKLQYHTGALNQLKATPAQRKRLAAAIAAYNKKHNRAR